MPTPWFQQITDAIITLLRAELTAQLAAFDCPPIAAADIQPEVRKLAANDGLFLNYAGTDPGVYTDYWTDAEFRYVVEILRFDPDPAVAQFRCGATEVAVRMILRGHRDLDGLVKRIVFEPSEAQPGRTREGRMGVLLTFPLQVHKRVSHTEFFV
jgi:hypothetical protein